jgi:fatty acid desaturase
LEVAADVRTLHAIEPRRNASALGFVALWAIAAAGASVWPTTLVLMLSTLAMALAIVAMQVVMHEAAHGLLCRTAAMNRWLGFVFGAPGLLGITAYRIVHSRHHRQSLEVSAAESILYGTPASIVVVPVLALRHAGSRERRAILQEYVVLGAAVGALAAAAGLSGRVDLLLRFWTWPLVLALLISSVRGWTEAAAERLVNRWPDLSARPGLQTLCRLVTDHLEHHLCPAMPWYHVPKLRALLREEYAAVAGDHVSYLMFLWDKVESKEAPLAFRGGARS